MRVQDLHLLIRFGDGWSFLYLEHCSIDKEHRAVEVVTENGRVPVPCANLALLMLGPGVSITHAAISVLADHGCLIVWCGEEGVRFYASGLGETRSAWNMLHQARAWADENRHMQVVRRLYQIRFEEEFREGLTLRQIRGLEGVRVREAYARASRQYGVGWSGRSYRRDDWNSANPVNRALSCGNACLYGICHAAIVSAGFSPALGFIHTGRMLSFVYDVADLYKVDITIPIAFQEVAAGVDGLERRTRIACRNRFAETGLLKRIIPDIQHALMIPRRGQSSGAEQGDEDLSPAGGLWEPGGGEAECGVNYGPGSSLEDGDGCPDTGESI